MRPLLAGPSGGASFREDVYNGLGNSNRRIGRFSVAYAFKCRVMVDLRLLWVDQTKHRKLRAEMTLADDCFLFMSDHENPPSFALPCICDDRN